MAMRMRMMVAGVVVGAVAAVAFGQAGGAGAGAATRVAGGGPPVSVVADAGILKMAAGPLVPRSVEDLKAIQARVEAVVKEAMPATVGIELPDAQGSGVIVSKDGYVLTAGHVSGRPNMRIWVRLSNGRRVRAVTLGANNNIDSGMIRITTPGVYPFVPVGTAKGLVAGQWVVSLGHPGGMQEGRPPVVRLGRVEQMTNSLIATDGPLFSGDSGGPMFDLDGRVVGIHSRIGTTTTQNIHVPIDTFLATWDRLAAGDMWGTRSSLAGLGGGGQRTASLGVKGVIGGTGVLVQQVYPGLGGSVAGLLEGDVITEMNGRAVRTPEELKAAVDRQKIGDAVRLVVMREEKKMEVAVRLTPSKREVEEEQD